MAVCLNWIVNINSQYFFIDIFFSIGFSELIGDYPSDLTKPSSPSLLFAEGSAEGAKRMHHTAGDALAVDLRQQSTCFTRISQLVHRG